MTHRIARTEPPAWRRIAIALFIGAWAIAGILVPTLPAAAVAPPGASAALTRADASRPIVLDPCVGTTSNRAGTLTPQSPIQVRQNSVAEGHLLAGNTVFQYDNRGNPVFSNGEINPNENGIGGLPYCSGKVTASGDVVSEWAFCVNQGLAGCANHPAVPEEDWGTTLPERPLTDTQKGQISYLLAQPDVSDKRARAMLQTQVWCISEGVTPGTIQVNARNYFNSHQFQAGASTSRGLPLTDEETRCATVPSLPASPELTVTTEDRAVDAGDTARFTVSTNLTTPITLSGAELRLCPGNQTGVTFSNGVLTLRNGGEAILCTTSSSHAELTVTADSGDIGLRSGLSTAWSMRPNCQSFVSYEAGEITRVSDSATVQFVGYGTFEVQKDYSYSGELTPGDLDDVEIDIEYAVIGTPPADAPARGTLKLTQENDFTATGPMYPVGTQLELTEHFNASALPPGLQWDGASWAVDGAPVSAPPLITIADRTVTSVSLTNVLSDRLGTFAVEKRFVDPAIDLTDVAVTVAWSGGGQSGEFVLTEANGFRAFPEMNGELALFPLGTQVLLTETTVTGLPAGVTFEPDWGPNTVPGSSPPQGAVTVATEWDPTLAAATQVTLVNGVNDERASLSVHKLVDSDDPGLALGEGHLDDVVIEVRASWAGGSTLLLLTPENNWATGLGYDLAPGTEVTLEETAIYSADPSVAWQDIPDWACADASQCRNNGDGTTTVTIGSGQDAAVTLTNRATVLYGTFLVEKRVIGDLDLDAERLQQTAFTVVWTSDETPAQTGTIILDAAGEWRGSPALPDGTPVVFPLGTTITLNETSIDPVDPGLTWGDRPVWSLGDQEDGSTEITITEVDTAVELSVTNPVSITEGSFAIEKLVHSTTELSSDDLVFTVEYGDGATISDTLLVTAGGQTESPNYPTGTRLTLQEAVVMPDPGVAGEWGEPVFVREDGSRSPGALTIVITTGERVLIELENSFIEEPPTPVDPPTPPTPVDPPTPAEPPAPGTPPTLSNTGGTELSIALLAALGAIVAGSVALHRARRSHAS